MAVLWITEYKNIAFDRFGNAMPVGIEPSVTQTMAITGASTTNANAFNADTRFLRLHCDTACYVEVGLSPTAVAPSPPNGSKRMAANQTEFFGLVPGAQVAVLQGT